MSLPPPPDSFGSQPPNGGEGPQWGGPQQQWAGGPPPNKGGKGKWILGGLVLVAVIAVSIAGTVIVLRSDSNGGDGPAQTSQHGDAEIASANDVGPVAIVTDDPTCDGWRKINNTLAEHENAGDWRNRDKLTPASEWTPEQRATYETIGKALSGAANDTVNLIGVTPHRVMRELYEQFVAYAREYATSVPSYTPEDNTITETAHTIMSTLISICSAIDYRPARAVAPMVPEADAPIRVATVGSTGDPQRFLIQSNAVCSEWKDEAAKFNDQIVNWQAISADTPATKWTPEEREVNDSVAPIMTNYAHKVEELGRRSGDPTMEDFAVLSAQYRRGYVKALPTYTAPDNDLVDVANFAAAIVSSACEAAG